MGSPWARIPYWGRLELVEVEFDVTTIAIFLLPVSAYGDSDHAECCVVPFLFVINVQLQPQI